MSAPGFRVVIAGRPNVGKSVLFNRLLGRRRSLVHDLPGMTRDVLETVAQLPDGRSYRLLDTGGYDPEGKEKIPRAVHDKAVEAIRQADLVLLVLDASAGVLPGDEAAARAVREAGRETLVIANKIDRREGQEGENEAWELGFAEVYGISAEHGIGVDDVEQAIALRLGAGETDDGRPRDREIALAVVGRPNVGKSSLVNALLGQDRAIVSETPGTTRDSVDVVLEEKGRAFRIVDTAGIRRKARTERGPEVLSVVAARKRIEDCDVALLVVDASAPPGSQDASVASYVNEAGKGLILVANKWDLVRGTASGAKDYAQALADKVPFARHAPVLLVSATTGRGVGRVLDAVERVSMNRRRRIPTGELNRVLGRALRDKAPRTATGRNLRVLYVAQTGAAPPTFTIVANRGDRLHFSEERRIENLLRETADFSGSPIRISVRARSSEDRETRLEKARSGPRRTASRVGAPSTRRPRKKTRR